MPPNSPKSENVPVNIRVNRYTRAKLAKYVNSLPDGEDKNASEVVRKLIDKLVEDVILTPEEEKSVEEEIRKAETQKKRK